MFPGDACEAFWEGGTLGPEPGTRPIGCPAPSCAISAHGREQKQRVSEICLPGCLFTLSAWKASQRGPQPQPPRRPRRARSCRRGGPAWPPGRGTFPFLEGVGWERRREGPRPSRGSSVGRGTERITVCTDRLEEVGAGRGLTHLSRRETWPLGPGARCLRKGPRAPFSERLRGSASRQALCLEGDCQALSSWFSLLLSSTSTPSTNFPFFLSLFFPLWMGNHRLQLPSACEESLPGCCVAPLPAADWPLLTNFSSTSLALRAAPPREPWDGASEFSLQARTLSQGFLFVCLFKLCFPARNNM